MGMIRTCSEFVFGDSFLRFLLDEESGQIGLQIAPAKLKGAIAEHREDLRGVPEIESMAGSFPIPKAWNVEPLVLVSCAGDIKPGGYAQGQTLRGGSTARSLRFQEQSKSLESGSHTVVTVSSSQSGLTVRHFLTWEQDDPAFMVYSEVENQGPSPITLELLSSFSFGFLTPFSSEDAPQSLFIHRFRSAWSAEGRHERRSAEELMLERSWHGHGVRCERFGQVGTKPVRRWFPFAAVEDAPRGVFWGAQLACAGSWQMEIYRKDDFLHLAGGLADRELGHWLKNLSPGERFSTPKAYIATVQGDLEDLCHRLTAMQEKGEKIPPASEEDLPVLFNEWCTTWGKPNSDDLIKIAGRLRNLEARYLVIDAGWYATEEENVDNSLGDWLPSPRLFPQGLKNLCAQIRAQGLIPGLWFEWEAAGPGSQIWKKEDLFLKRDGRPIQVGSRRFLDLRKPEAHAYLEERVIGLLQECRFGYIKVDQNETVGIGADGAESLGEGLRQHVEGVKRFFRRLHESLPEVVIENCSSGGHRLEPEMISLTDMSSFSDAHEVVEIPIIAANLQRLVLPRKLQIWATLRARDTERRLVYSLAAGYLGRLCLSGDLIELSAEQLRVVKQAIALYRKVWPVIKRGKSRRSGPAVESYRHPRGWQAVVRYNESGDSALVVFHHFQGEGESIRIPLIPKVAWRIETTLQDAETVLQVEPGTLIISRPADFSATVAYLLQ